VTGVIFEHRGFGKRHIHLSGRSLAIAQVEVIAWLAELLGTLILTVLSDATLAAQAGRRIMTLSDDRLHDLIRFYEILDMLAERIGGPRILAECTGRAL